MADALPNWAPEGLDLTTASAARIYDYFLGGAHNFAADRELAKKLLQVVPDLPRIAQGNRAFLHRAVRYLVGEGIRQFIDIGSGIPTVGSVHDTVVREGQQANVLYVDHDPVAVAHSELLLEGNPHARVLQADLRRPADILDSAERAELIDLTQPVGVLMVALLHFLRDEEDPAAAIRAFHDRLAPGSFLVISHVTGDGQKSSAASAADLYASSADGLTVRTREQVERLFDGWDLVDPGLVWLSQWRPNWPDEAGPDPSTSFGFAGVGRRGA